MRSSIRRSAIPWQLGLIGLTSVTAGLFLLRAFASRFMIQDDARQFLSWMGRLARPGAMPGDLTADYFQSVSPPLFRLIYALPAAIGLEPVVTGKLLVPLLLIASAVAAWRVATAITSRPAAAFVTAACAMLAIIHDDGIFSATPRAFFAPLFLVFLDGMLRERRGQTVIALTLLAAIYPAPALVGLTMLGLSRICWRPGSTPRLARGSLPLLAIATVAVGLAILPLRSETRHWAPTVTLAQARTMPVFMSHDGRSNLVETDGRMHWLCSDRLGFVPSVVNCHGDFSRGALIDIALFIVPILVLTARTLFRRRQRRVDAEPGELLFVQALVAAGLWWAIAALVAFDLHLPGRYSQHVLAVVGALALGRLIATLADPVEHHPAIGIGVGALLIAGFATPKMRLVEPDDAAAMVRIAAMPPAVRIAGISDMLDFVPALTGRSVLASAETAIPYQLGYFRAVSQRMAASVVVLGTPDRATFADLVQRYRIDVIAVDRGLLAGRPLAPRYVTLIPAGPSPGPTSWVAVHAAACPIYTGRTLLLLDAKCLARIT